MLSYIVVIIPSCVVVNVLRVYSSFSSNQPVLHENVTLARDPPDPQCAA